MPRKTAPSRSRYEKLPFVRRRSGYYFKEPESGIERVFRKESIWDPTPQKVRTWLSMCKSRDAKTRLEGLFALRRSGAVSRRVVDLASDALRDEARSRSERTPRTRRSQTRGLLTALTHALDPEDDLSGSEIVRTLRELGDRRAVAPLRTLLRDITGSPLDRALAELPGERAHYALTVIDALLALGARHEREILLEFLDHREDVIRSLALSILHDRAGPWSRPALRRVLDSDRPFYRRIVAAEALLPMGDRQAESFIRGAAESRDPDERRLAVPALALRHQPEDLDLLEGIWKKETLVDERLELGVVLQEWGRLTTRRVFWGPLNHPYPHIRLKAARLLLALQVADGVALLQRAMGDEPDRFIRKEVEAGLNGADAGAGS